MFVHFKTKKIRIIAEIIETTEIKNNNSGQTRT